MSSPQNIIKTPGFLSGWFAKIITGLDEQEIVTLMAIMLEEKHKKLEDNLKAEFEGALRELIKVQFAEFADSQMEGINSFTEDALKKHHEELFKSFKAMQMSDGDTILQDLKDKFSGQINELKDVLNAKEVDLSAYLCQFKASCESTFAILSTKINQLLKLSIETSTDIKAIKVAMEAQVAQDQAMLGYIKDGDKKLKEISEAVTSLKDIILKLDSRGILGSRDEGKINSFIESENAFIKDIQGEAITKKYKMKELLWLQQKLSLDIYDNSSTSITKLNEIKDILIREDCPVCGASLKEVKVDEACRQCMLFKKGDVSISSTSLEKANKLGDIFRNIRLKYDGEFQLSANESPFPTNTDCLALFPNYYNNGDMYFKTELLRKNRTTLTSFKTIIITRRIQKVVGKLKEYFPSLNKIIIQPRRGGLAVQLALENNAFDGIEKEKIINGAQEIESSSWNNIK